MSSLKALIKQHNERSRTLIEPIRLSFGEKGEDGKEKGVDKGDGVLNDEDLQKPFKEVLRSPFTRRLIEFSAPKHLMSTILRIYDGSTDPDNHISRSVGVANQGEWQMPVWCMMFQQTLDGPARDPTEVSKIIRRANETLIDFKERWTDEMSYIHDVLEVMRISAFMRNSKCTELARRSFDQGSFWRKDKGQATVVIDLRGQRMEEVVRGRTTKRYFGYRTSAATPSLPPPPMIGTAKKRI
ncbi:hypothetical protein Tco_0637661 [Tanacetum coccineum]